MIITALNPWIYPRVPSLDINIFNDKKATVMMTYQQRDIKQVTSLGLLN